jgi:hypothetical protein
MKEKKQNLSNDRVFFFRQKYSVSDESFIPENLPSTCYCNKAFNPDKNFIQCKECRKFIHMECFLSAETQSCFNCSNNIESQLSHNTTTNEFLGVKRTRLDEPEIRDKTNENVEEKKIDEGKTLYPNLTEERRKYLISLIEQLDKRNLATRDRGISQEEKSRKIIRDKICYSLLYGIEELRESADWSRMKASELKADITDDEAIKHCTNLGIAIESAIFVQNGDSSVNYFNLE